jgi:hypothetical protein
MRHDQALGGREFDIVDVAAIWPRAGVIVQPPIPEPLQQFRPAIAAPDMPEAVGTMIVGVYAAIMGIFFLTMANGAHATLLVIGITALVVLP